MAADCSAGIPVCVGIAGNGAPEFMANQLWRDEVLAGMLSGLFGVLRGADCLFSPGVYGRVSYPGQTAKGSRASTASGNPVSLCHI